MRLLPLAYYFENAYDSELDSIATGPSKCRLCGWVGVHTRAHLRVIHGYQIPDIEYILKLRDEGKLRADLNQPRIEKRRVIP